MLKFGFRNHKTLRYHRKQCFFLCGKSFSCSVHIHVTLQTHLVHQLLL